MIYLLIYVVQLLMQALYLALAYGVPAFIAWRILRHMRHDRRRMGLWIAAGVIWVIPTAVELMRDRWLDNWIAALPPDPVVMLKAGRMIALEGGTFDSKLGHALFANCADGRYKRPLCQFELGPDDAVDGFSIGVPEGPGWRRYVWGQHPDCNLEQRYQGSDEAFAKYMNVQGICAVFSTMEGPPQDYALSLRHGSIPRFPGVTYGQLILRDLADDAVLSTLTSFEVERPLYPALWGVHWLPVLRYWVPKRHRDLRYGTTYDEAVMTGFPPRTLQSMVYAIGWNEARWQQDTALAALEEAFPYRPNATLPALRSGAFFPTRFALETVCHPRFRDRITPEVMTEVRRIAALETPISNGYPNRLAQEALESDCVTGR